MAIIAGVDSKTRERVYTEDYNEQLGFGREAFKTSAGQRFLTNYENNQENLAVILEAAHTLYPGELVTVSRFVTALTAAMDAGDLARKATAPVVEPAPVPEVPRDKNGHPLTAAQIQWGNYQRFLNESSSSQIAERRRTDPGFRAFIQHNLREEMDQPIDGDMRATNPHLTPKAPTQATLADKYLVEWADRYRTMSSADIRKAKRYDTNPLGAKKFNDDEARAIELHLI